MVYLPREFERLKTLTEISNYSYSNTNTNSYKFSYLTITCSYFINAISPLIGYLKSQYMDAFWYAAHTNM